MRRTQPTVNPTLKDKKLAEATFFLARMGEAKEDAPAHGYYLSAFLGAARSVLQVAHKEIFKGQGTASPIPPDQKWYVDQTTGPVVSFMRDQRDDNVHSQPVERISHTAVDVSSVMSVGAFNPITGESFKFDEAPPLNEGKPFTICYTFRDWPDGGSVDRLCAQYLQTLERFVRDGRALGYLG